MTPTEGTTEVQAALATLAAAREGSYYDAAADGESRAAYYATVDGDATGADLFDALSALVTRTHTSTPEYKPFVHLYPDVDLHPDGQLHSIYTGETFVPERLIAEDAEIFRRRQEQLAQRLAGPAATDEETLFALQGELDAVLRFNCEHVVPQSWFAHREPMRGDLHHLFTCEPKCNEFRASHAFFDFPDFMESVRTGCGKREENRFEPVLGKGEASRATLYFLVRYPDKLNRAAIGLDGDRIATLIRWHEGFGVTDHERRRNAAIEGKQGNRNPFIDHPDWAARISSHLAPG